MKALGEGNYFTSEKLTGQERYGSRVIEAYLNIRNPYFVQGSFAESVSADFKIDPGKTSYKEIQQLMRDKGYDGVVSRKKNGDIAIAVAFDSNQIKSATGNIGTFDGKDPSINHSLNVPTTLPSGEDIRAYTRKQWERYGLPVFDESGNKITPTDGAVRAQDVASNTQDSARKSQDVARNSQDVANNAQDGASGAVQGAAQSGAQGTQQDTQSGKRKNALREAETRAMRRAQMQPLLT